MLEACINSYETILKLQHRDYGNPNWFFWTCEPRASKRGYQTGLYNNIHGLVSTFLSYENYMRRLKKYFAVAMQSLFVHLSGEEGNIKHYCTRRKSKRSLLTSYKLPRKVAMGALTRISLNTSADVPWTGISRSMSPRPQRIGKGVCNVIPG